MSKKYTIKLTDGKTINNLEFKGINFISDNEIDEHIFKDNLKSVVISDGESENTYNQMELIHLIKKENHWIFALRILSDKEMLEIKEKEENTLLVNSLGDELVKNKLERIALNKSLKDRDSIITNLGKELSKNKIETMILKNKITELENAKGEI